ncbi:U-scoloptoxin(16)-Er13a [Procambarus clarkii]|uniref:U-scoloptoxin(16)-Er13a n=1 Tax=Procambarus clarkii TaxID=6728 RepID=UPI001E672B02|nr:U-scoloptoxin(16)-Er13a-like [Procambarus clarkii]
MGHLLRVAVLAACLSLVMADVWHEHAQDPNNPDHCLVSVPFGTEWQGPGCATARCHGPPGDATVSYYSCGKIIVAPPCYVTEIDNSKPHPECCPHAVCPKN